MWAIVISDDILLAIAASTKIVQDQSRQRNLPPHMWNLRRKILVIINFHLLILSHNRIQHFNTSFLSSWITEEQNYDAAECVSDVVSENYIFYIIHLLLHCFRNTAAGSNCFIFCRRYPSLNEKKSRISVGRIDASKSRLFRGQDESDHCRFSKCRQVPIWVRGYDFVNMGREGWIVPWKIRFCDTEYSILIACQH